MVVFAILLKMTSHGLQGEYSLLVKTLRFAIPFTVICIGMATSVLSQSLAPSKNLVAAIDKLVAGNEVDGTQPGVAILVHKPGTLLFKQGYGLANLKDASPITTRTQFEIASCSKPFTATAVLLLHDRKKLSIDQDVRSILTELPEYSPERPILIRDLLSHTSGLPEYFDFEVVPKKGRSYLVNADYLPLFARLKSDYPQEFKPGARYSYCNSNYLLLALVVERVSGKGFGEFMKEEFFLPAGMNDTFIYSSPQAIPAVSQVGINRAIGYEWSDRKAKWNSTWGAPPDRSETGLTVGDGGIWTNMEDMLKWDIAIRGRKWLKPETWKIALAPATTRGGKPFGYGLGWQVYFEDPKQIYGFGHNGSWSGFRTNYYYDHATERTTILLSNRSDFEGDEFWEQLNNIIQRFQK